MNQIKTVLGRQESTHLIIQQELEKLKNKAYNPITNKFIQFVNPQLDIKPSTPFIIALTLVKKVSASVSTKRDLRSIHFLWRCFL